MSLLHYGFVGRYTNSTYPNPPCGFFDWTIDGTSIEFGTYQSRICIPNKVVIAFTVTNCLAISAMWIFGIYLTVREFWLVRGWNDTKNFLLFYFVGAVGAGLFAVNDIVGSPVWNSIAWYLATVGVVTMEAFTVLVWARVTLKIIDIRRGLVVNPETSPNDLMKWLSRVMAWLTVFVCIVLAPVFGLRAAWYNFEDPWWYNTLMFAYHLIMIPWFPVFAAAVIVFGVKLTKLLQETTKPSVIINGGTVASGTVSYSRRSGNGATSTFYENENRAQSNKEKVAAVIKKVRLVAILVFADKLGFFLCYTTFVVYGGTTMYEPERGMAAYFSYIAMNGLIVFWGCALLMGCGWYHLRADRSSSEVSRFSNSSGDHDDNAQLIPLEADINGGRQIYSIPHATDDIASAEK
ncbi:hypothetical protein BJ742DRAFT_787605 [Cladochytrium replicatum]|nr:hypothetical protein BJ742DRAFT_787605 [Cladochytrium replicatum]